MQPDLRQNPTLCILKDDRKKACPSGRPGVRRRRVFCAFLAVAGAWLAAGCGRTTAADSAMPPTRPAAVQRIVSLSPNLTEIVCALGAGDRLAGRSRVCEYPPEIVGRVPVVGDFCRPSLEKLVAVRPDLVLQVDSSDPALDRRVDELGIARKVVACRTLAEIPTAILEVGRAIGREDAAMKMAAEFTAELARCRRAPPPGRAPAVFIEIWPDPLMTAGKNSFVAELVRLAGGRNLGDELDRDYAAVSSEWVLAHDPEVVLCLSDAARAHSQTAAFRERTGWNQLRAVRDGRVFGGFDTNLLLKPGPRVLQALPALRAALGTAPPSPGGAP